MQTSLLPEAGSIPERILSGGQTGVDRAALDAAMGAGVPCGGWCPRGRKAEDGVIPARYPLTETPTDAYEQRTRWNVRDSDGTLILTEGVLGGGTALAAEVARHLGRPLLVVDLNLRPSRQEVGEWLRSQRIAVVNIAGPRESQAPGIHARAREFLEKVLDKGARPGP